MNPELRAQLEKLDVWQLALAQRKTPSTTNKDELNRQGWKAYYEVEKQKRVVSGKEDEPIHVPACFREAAAEDGVYRESSESKTSLSPVPSRDSDSTKMKELKNTVLELNQKTEQLSSEKQTLQQELEELKLKEQDFLKQEQEFSRQEQDLKSEIAGLKIREQNFEIAIQELKSQNSELCSEIQTLRSKEQDLLSKLDQIEHDHSLKLQSLESSTPPQTESVPEQVSILQQQLQETTEQLEKALSEAESQKTETESVMVLF